MKTQEEMLQSIYESIRELYSEICLKIPSLSDTQYSISNVQFETFRALCIATNQTIALYQPATDSYNFLHVRNPAFRYFDPDNVRFYDIMCRMHPDDYSHLYKACRLAHTFLKKMPHNDVLRYSLTFECRMMDKNGIYLRIMFNYQIVMIPETNHGVLLLQLNTVDGCKTNIPHTGINVIDLHKQTVIPLTQLTVIPPRAIEILRYNQNGLTCKEIAQLLSISEETVRNHRSKLLPKLKLKETQFAYIYLQRLGLI